MEEWPLTFALFYNTQLAKIGESHDRTIRALGNSAQMEASTVSTNHTQHDIVLTKE